MLTDDFFINLMSASWISRVIWRVEIFRTVMGRPGTNVDTSSGGQVRFRRVGIKDESISRSEILTDGSVRRRISRNDKEGIFSKIFRKSAHSWMWETSRERSGIGPVSSTSLETSSHVSVWMLRKLERSIALMKARALNGSACASNIDSRNSTNRREDSFAMSFSVTSFWKVQENIDKTFKRLRPRIVLSIVLLIGVEWSWTVSISDIIARALQYNPKNAL